MSRDHRTTQLTRPIASPEVPECPLKAFKLDYIGGAREGDIAQAGVSLESVGDEAVEFKVKVNYSAATYTGEVSVLVIADLFDHPVP